MSVNLTLADKLAADVFQKSYRKYLELKPTHYRWSHLAPQSVDNLSLSIRQNWSVEKLADYLHCPVDEAEGCLRRFKMSQRVNGKETTAEKIRQAIFEWMGGVVELDEKAKRALSDDLAHALGNQLYASGLTREDILAVASQLEKADTASKAESLDKEPEASSNSKPSEIDPPKWGPQWKD